MNDVAIKTEAELISDKLFEWLKHNKKPKEVLRTAEMQAAMIREGHNKRNISDGIKLLNSQGWLGRQSKGRWIFNYGDDTVVNFMPDED